MFDFYKKNLVPLLINAEVWILIYNVFLLLFMDEQFTIKKILRQLLFLQTPSIISFWYIPMLISLYIAYPFVAKILKEFSLKSLRLVLVLSVCLYFFFPSFNKIASISGLPMLGESSIQSVLFNGLYLSYAIIGYYFLFKYTGRFSNSVLYLIFILSLFSVIIFQYYSWNADHGFWVWYNSLGILFAALSFSLLVKNSIQSNEHKRAYFGFQIIEPLSKHTLGIFFSHVPIQMILKKFLFKADSILNIFSVLIFSLGFSYLFSVGVLILKKYLVKSKEEISV